VGQIPETPPGVPTGLAWQRRGGMLPNSREIGPRGIGGNADQFAINRLSRGGGKGSEGRAWSAAAHDTMPLRESAEAVDSIWRGVATPTWKGCSSGRTAPVSDIIALLHFADNPMEQAESDHFVLT
jgi:hypothetical protein